MLSQVIWNSITQHILDTKPIVYLNGGPRPTGVMTIIPGRITIRPPLLSKDTTENHVMYALVAHQDRENSASGYAMLFDSKGTLPGLTEENVRNGAGPCNGYGYDDSDQAVYCLNIRQFIQFSKEHIFDAFIDFPNVRFKRPTA